MRSFSRLVLLPMIGISIGVGQTIESYRTCQDCHAQTAAEWKISRHSFSSAEKNPIYRAVRAQIKSRDVKQCDFCHQPIGQMGLNEFDARKLQDEGVNCDVCHAVNPANAMRWEIIPGNIKLSPHKDAVPISHKVVYSKFLVSSNACLVCHGDGATGKKSAAVCGNDADYRRSEFARQGVTCQECHMPAMEGKTTELGKIREVHTHIFYGGYYGEILRNCADLQLTLKPSASELTAEVKVTNRTVGHALPGGSPLRMVVLTVRAFNEGNELLWQNYRSSLFEDTKALFMRLYEEETNGFTAPWEGAALRADQRLKAGESRTLSYTLPKENVHHVTAALTFYLVPPSLAERLGLPEKPYSAPVPIVTVTQPLVINER